MNKDLINGFENIIKSGMDVMDVPGLVIAVVKDDQVVYQNAFGYADLENQIPMTTDHILPLGSSTKTFTAAAVAMLAGEGLLDLDRPLRDYIPEFRLYDSVATVQATTRDILCHRTGLPRHDFMWIGWDSLSRREIMDRIRYLENSQTFRSVWQYQNIMYAVAGYLTEKISGITWEEFVSERIFSPLGMKNTNLNATTTQKAGRMPLLYEKDAAGIHQPCKPLVLNGIAPAGGINATVGDAARWIRFNLSNGMVNEKPLIDSGAFSQLQTPNIPYQLLPFDLDGITRVGYGLGWFIDNFKGVKLLDHGGNVNGATALVSYVPELNAGCAIMANATSTFLPKALSYTIYDYLLGHGTGTDWVAAINDKLLPFRSMQSAAMQGFKNSQITGKPMTHTPQEYAGTYTHPGYGEVYVSADDRGQLWIKYHEGDYPLVHLHYDIFYFEIQEIPVPVSAITGIDGSIQSIQIDLEGTLPPIAFTACRP